MSRILIFVGCLCFLASCKNDTQGTQAANDVAQSTSTVKTIYLIRHAEKASVTEKDPKLSDQGMYRANKLIDMFKNKPLNRIFSTNYKRTRATVIPVARSKDMKVMPYNPGKLEEFSKNLLAINEKNILVVGHSNSTPTLANHILGTEKFEKFDEEDYGNFITITIDGDKKTAELTRF